MDLSLVIQFQQGADGIIRNHDGEWVGGFYRNVGRASNVIAGFWALRDGHSLANDLNITNLRVEMDAKNYSGFS